MQHRLVAPDRVLAGDLFSHARLAAAARRVGAAAQRALLSDILSIFLATRLAFLLLTYFGRALLRDPALVGQSQIGFSGYLLDAWFYRDSQWYLAIVQHGYHYFGRGHVSAVAFFPVYPLLVGFLQAISGMAVGVAAMVVSNLSFLAALVYLHKLCEREFGTGVARRAVFYLAIFPTSFFTFAAYSESLFLLLSIGCFYYLRGERWWMAALLGALAAATRILGVLLLLAFVWEYLRAHRFDPRRFRLDLLAGTLIPGGIGLYMVYLYGLTGDATAFVKAEAGWNRIATWPWQVLSTSLQDVPLAAREGAYFQAHAFIENGLVIACLLLILVGIRRIPTSMVLYGLCSLGVLLSAPVLSSRIPLTSMSRYVLVLFPVTIVLAQIGRWAIFDRLYVLLSTGGLAIFTMLFLNHMWGA